MLVATSRAVFLATVVVVVGGRVRAFATRASRRRAVRARACASFVVVVVVVVTRVSPFAGHTLATAVMVVVIGVVVELAAHDAVPTERTNDVSIERAPVVVVVVVVVAFGEQSMVFMLEVPLVHVEIRPLAQGDEHRGEGEDAEEEDRQRLLGRFWRARGDHRGGALVARSRVRASARPRPERFARSDANTRRRDRRRATRQQQLLSPSGSLSFRGTRGRP